MDTTLGLAYSAYMVWLLAGFGDFLCHRRTDLPHTSGVAESFTHLLQLAVLGIAIVIGLACEMGRTIAVLLIVLVAAHAGVGYWDTRIAFRRRRTLLPIEQHLHSILDMAPVVALGWVLAQSWPEALRDGWQVALRMPALPATVWIAVLLPAFALCVVPAMAEFRAARAVRLTRP